MSSPRAEAAAASLRHPLTLTLLALTFSTGTVDAVSYLALGSGFGGILARSTGHRHPVHVGYALGLETLALGIATIIAAVTHPHPGRLPAHAMIVCMAMGMGLRNATVRHIGVPDMTTTVLTMTLTGLAADAAIVGGPGKGSARRLSAIARCSSERSAARRCCGSTSCCRWHSARAWPWSPASRTALPSEEVRDQRVEAGQRGQLGVRRIALG